MADKVKPAVFVRESTGLVKNVSLLDALTLNMGNMSAGAALATIGFTMASLASVAGVNLVYASIIAFILSVPQIVVYSLMGSRIKADGRGLRLDHPLAWRSLWVVHSRSWATSSRLRSTSLS